MRIGFDAEVLTEGKTAPAHYLAKLIEHLAKLDPKLEIFLFAPDKICVDYEPYLRGTDARRVVERLPKAQRSRWPGKVLPRLLKEHKIDVFHTPVKDSLPFFRPPCPTVITVFDIAPRGFRDALRGLVEQWRFKARYIAWSRMAKRILTVSETARKDVLKLCRIASKQVTVTELGAGDNTPDAISSEEEENILRKYHLDGKTFVVSVSGLDRRHRDPDFIIEAFADCHRRLSKDVVFVFTGNNYRSEGYYARTLRKMEMHGIRDRVIATGFIPDKVFKAILANAAVAVVTPFHSGTSLAVLESFALGVPVIASDRGAVPEVAGDAAIMVDPYDSKAISDALCRLLDNQMEHDLYAEKGVVQAREFSWEKMAKQTLEVYEQVCGE